MKGRGLIVAFTILILTCAIMQISLSNLGLMRNSQIGSGFFPFWVGVFIVVLVLIQIIIESKALVAESRQIYADNDRQDVKVDNKLYLKPLLIILSLVIYVFAIDFFGFLVSSIVFLTISMHILGNKISRALLSAILTSGIVFIVLDFGLKVRLPSGLLI